MIILENDQPLVALEIKLDSRVSVEELAKRMHKNPETIKIHEPCESWEEVMKILATLKLFKKL